MTDPSLPGVDYSGIRGDIAALLEMARRAAACNVNALMTATYWENGPAHRIRAGRAAARQSLRVFLLSSACPGGCGSSAFRQGLLRAKPRADAVVLPRVVRCTFRATASAKSDLATLAQAFPLPWSAYVRLLSVKNEQARAFYETEALRGGWSVRQLDRQIGSQFYERAALSRDKAVMLRQGELAELGDLMTPEQAIKDPFVLEFLNLKGRILRVRSRRWLTSGTLPTSAGIGR